MKTTQEIRNMLARFDEASNDEGLDDDGEAARCALEWVLGHHVDAELEAYLPVE